MSQDWERTCIICLEEKELSDFVKFGFGKRLLMCIECNERPNNEITAAVSANMVSGKIPSFMRKRLTKGAMKIYSKLSGVKK